MALALYILESPWLLCLTVALTGIVAAAKA